jgi:hypothetical protein
MARPKKQGVDYFSLDVHCDNKIKFLKIKFGMLGFGTLISLYQHIYFNGYFCEWKEDDILLFADEIKVDINLLNEIITECFSRSIFSKECYDCYKILTSSGIQKRYCEIIKRRQESDIVAKYLVNANNNLVNVCNNSINVNKSTQSKVNKTETEIKVNENNNSDKSEDVKKPDQYKQEFEIFRKAFTGTKNGLDTEFENFTKKNKNYKEIIPLLLPAIQRENDHRAKASELGEFFPISKSLSVWIGKKCWEQELPAFTNKTNNTKHEYEKTAESQHDKYDFGF